MCLEKHRSSNLMESLQKQTNICTLKIKYLSNSPGQRAVSKNKIFETNILKYPVLQGVCVCVYLCDILEIFN